MARYGLGGLGHSPPREVLPRLPRRRLPRTRSWTAGSGAWPATHPIPQSTIEFEVGGVEAAAAELHGEGYGLVHPVRTEPWGQVIARFQSPDGVLLGVCSTPHLADA